MFWIGEVMSLITTVKFLYTIKQTIALTIAPSFWRRRPGEYANLNQLQPEIVHIKNIRDSDVDINDV